MRAWRAAYTASTRGNGGGLAGANDMSSRGEYDKDGYVLTGGVEPLSWRVLVGSVLALASSVISSSLVWKKSTVVRTMELISPTETSCTISSSLMYPRMSGVLAYLEGEFLVD